MKTERDPCKTASASDTAPPGVSLRAMYAEALREVMTDPRKALAEHDPRLAMLLGCTPPAVIEY